MRSSVVSFFLLLSAACASQERILINEVLPGNKGITADSTGRTPDWIELHNPSSRAVDVKGWRIAMAGRQHVFTSSLAVPARGYRTLWCDGRANDGDDHIAFKLAREGGALLLIAPDGISIADVFSFPAIPANVSIGRLPDGAKTWSFFTMPSPSSRNGSAEGIINGQCTTPAASHYPGQYEGPFELELRADTNATIRYTLDGTKPSKEHSLLYASPIHIGSNTVVRAMATAPGKLTSEHICATYIIGSDPGEAFCLNLAPSDLWGDSTGIYDPGLFNNNTRSGKAWERHGVAQWPSGRTANVGVRISGSGSRGARKRSFKLYVRDGSTFVFPDSTRVDEGFLRADAGPQAFLRNTTIQELAQRFRLHAAVQPSEALPLYLNAAYWGLYRWMPAKDGEWLRQKSGAEALDVLEGPAAVALNGNNDHFLDVQDLLLRGAALDSIEAVVDTKSLIDLACIDLWTGRADHDLNVRCYRPRQPGGRWRWVLFDMDLWAPAEENSVARMCSAAAPETPFVPQLLAHPELQILLLARITALQAAVFSRTAIIADSIHRANEADLLADHRRWELELDMPHPDSSLAQLTHFAGTRPAYLFAHLSKRTGRKLRMVTIEAPPAEQGQLLIDGLPLAPGKQEVRCFNGVPLEMEARASGGSEFAGWKGLDLDTAKGAVDLSKARNVRVQFRAVVP